MGFGQFRRTEAAVAGDAGAKVMTAASDMGWGGYLGLGLSAFIALLVLTGLWLGNRRR